MTSRDGKDEHRAGHRLDEDPRAAEERVERRDQPPADCDKRRACGEEQRADGEQRVDGRAADAQHAPAPPGRERIEAPRAGPAPAEHAPPPAQDDHERVMQRRDREDPDVLLDIPIVKVDEISLNVEDLSAQVSVAARVGNLVVLNVGAEAHLGRLNLTIKGVEAQALLKVYLENIYAVLARTLTTLDRNPELVARLLEPVGQAVSSLGRTVEQTVPQLGQSLGSTVEKTVPEVGKSVGSTVEKTVPEVGKSVGSTVERTVPEVGRSVGDPVEKAVPRVGRAAEDTGKLRPSRVMQPLTRAVHRVADKTRRVAGPTGDLSRIRRRGAAMVRNVTRRLSQGTLRR